MRRNRTKHLSRGNCCTKAWMDEEDRNIGKFTVRPIEPWGKIVLSLFGAFFMVSVNVNEYTVLIVLWK